MQNVDTLIDRLEQLRAQKAELERQEKAVANELRQLLKQQQDRLKKLGIATTDPAEPPAAGPARAS